MALTLTTKQRNYLNKSGPMKASTLERVFEKSIKDQEEIKRKAAKIRSKQK